MTKTYGPLMQNSFIVANLDEAIDHWAKNLSVGPFFEFPPLKFVAGTLHGKPHIPTFRAAIAYSGDLMIELIQPQGPSIFQEFLDEGGTGVHHNCVATTNHDTAAATLHKRGGTTLQYQDDGNGSRMSYIKMPGPTPIIIEVAELHHTALTLFATIKAAATTWDGTNSRFNPFA
jgi:hypothetical protein